MAGPTNSNGTKPPLPTPKGIWILVFYLVATFIAVGVALWFQWPVCEPKPVGSSDERCTTTSTTTSSSTTTTIDAGTKATNTTTSTSSTTLVLGDLRIRAVTPDRVSVYGCDDVRIDGNGFQVGARARIGGVICDTKRTDETTLVAFVPPHEKGKFAVTVINPDDRAVTSPDALTFVCPSPSEGSLILIILLAGALGGTLHALRSLFWYVGNREFVTSWVPMYIILPFSSAAMALVFYLLIRGGFWTPRETDSYTAVVAVGSLVGMFSTIAAVKLKQIAEAILTKPEEGRDSSSATHDASSEDGDGSALTLEDVSPPTGALAGGDVVILKGTGFVQGATVTFGSAPATVLQTTATAIVVQAPAAPAAGPVDVTITLPDGRQVTKTGAYTY